jgi:phenylacetate-CoA ligase
MNTWNPRYERMPAADLDRLQYRLVKTLAYRLYSFSPFYHERMREAEVHPDDIRSLADVRKLPFMYKRDLRDTYPDGLFTSPREELVRYHVSSGTTGKPTVVGYTEKDLDLWTESLARGLTSIGLGSPLAVYAPLLLSLCVWGLVVGGSSGAGRGAEIREMAGEANLPAPAAEAA